MGLGGYNVATIHFRYHGVIDFHTLYREMRNFWAARTLKFYEQKYKHKGDEFEGEWRIEHKVDAYNMLVYKIEFKASDMRPLIRNGKEVFEGKMQMHMYGDHEENFSQSSIAGKEEIFEETSWLHKIYKKVTYRDRDEGMTTEAHVLIHQFHELVKQICNAEAKE
jgi:hypothetical protein